MPQRLNRSLAALLLTTALAAPAMAQDITLQSAGPLEFAPGDGQGILFVGDSLGARVVAFELADGTLDDQVDYQLGRVETFEGRTMVDDLAAAIGDLVGAPADQISINDMAVHPGTRQIVLSVHRGLGPDALPFLVKVDRGTVSLLETEALASSAHNLTPPGETNLEFGQPAAAYAVTDVDWHDGEIFVAGVSGEDFNSTLRRVGYPFTGNGSETQIEIWHAVHAQWETRAPIIAQEIAEVNGEPTLIAVYACTPLVRIPLADLEDGALVRGEMIGELGYGNTPVDLVHYTNPMDGAETVLVTHTHRSANAIPLEAIGSADPMPVEVPNNFGPAGLTGFPVPASDIRHLAMIDDAWAAAVRPDPTDPTRLQLHSVLSPFFFDRADHMVEMNWPGSADPFGYRQFPSLSLTDG
ncbi:hypothetical protein [Roseobacter weihaiensis]|uniref:hypothetical protein n=1 Tax=Roseobacter weihaiensis TaxID=2763262 RepID=UPI001D0B0EA6|nr:hypothetical protein [Roseobacter sp. H9]